MMNRCLLKTNGYRVGFEFQNWVNNQEDVELVIKFLLDPQLGQVKVKSRPFLMAVEDLERLITYFKQHLKCLAQDPDYESSIFTPLELGFQLQALSGEIRALNDGEFSLSFMLNVGRGDDDASVYVGGEGVVMLSNLNIFIASIQQILKLPVYA